MKRHPEKNEGWERTLKRLLPLWGHRNWIVIADSAYPAQANPGIETIATGSDHLHVLKTTLQAIDESKHVRANVYLDAELESVTEQDVRGIDRYRKALVQLTNSHGTKVLPHEQIIARLDESARLFRVLIFKSPLTIPYTSVFLELDCGYWTPEAEKRMRLSLKNK